MDWKNAKDSKNTSKFAKSPRRVSIAGLRYTSSIRSSGIHADTASLNVATEEPENWEEDC